MVSGIAPTLHSQTQHSNLHTYEDATMIVKGETEPISKPDFSLYYDTTHCVIGRGIPMCNHRMPERGQAYTGRQGLRVHHTRLSRIYDTPNDE